MMPQHSPSLVSVCVPTYNGEKHLRACLDSILRQTFTNFELLLIDDCSTDSTASILLEYAKKDSRIRFVQNKQNLGLVANWNKCVELAHGEWIKFLFQDDLLHVHCIERMLTAANRPIVFCRREFIFEEGTDKETAKDYLAIPGVSDLVTNPQDINPSEIQNAVLREPRNFFGEPTAALLHRSVFERFGLFNTDLAQFCDLEFWIRVSSSTGLSYVDESLATFRYHRSSTSAGNRTSANDERVSLFDHLVLMHELSYNRLFEPLRLRALEPPISRDFRRELAEKSVWIRARARTMASDTANPDRAWLIQWNRLIAKYPKLASHRNILMSDLKSAWNRYLGWRLA